MSTGNQHHEKSAELLEANTNGPSYVDPNTLGLSMAQTEATLALAYEQRTANLIALYTMDDSARQGMIDGADMHSGNWVDVTRQIKERLGLA
jgi:hypothetical protein